MGVKQIMNSANSVEMAGVRFETCSAIHMSEPALNSEINANSSTNEANQMIDDVVVVQSGLPSMMESDREVKPSTINTMNKTVSCFDKGNLLILHKKNNFTKESKQESFT